MSLVLVLVLALASCVLVLSDQKQALRPSDSNRRTAAPPT
jgi:hypothetical protein